MVDALARPDPETAAFLRLLAESGDPPITTLSPEAARAAVIAGLDLTAPRPAAEIEDRVVQGEPTGSVRLRIVRPAGAQGVLPAVVYYHGGGWVLGDAQEYDHLLRDLAHNTGAAVVFVDYDLCPEVRFPVPLEQAYAALCWVVEHGGEAALDATRVVVAGDSAGGNLAAAVALLAIDRGGADIALQALLYPIVDADFETPSYQAFGTGHYLTRDEMEWFWDHYLPDHAARRQPLAAPLRADPQVLRQLPPALVITCELDVLRDEGEAYARALLDAGVPVAAARYLGAIHGCLTIPGIRDIASSRAMLAQLYAAIREALTRP
jgi:acetyl esterase